MQGSDDFAIGCEYRLLGICDSEVAADGPHLAYVDGRGGALQHSAEIVGVHRSQGRTTICSFAERERSATDHPSGEGPDDASGYAVAMLPR